MFPSPLSFFFFNKKTNVLHKVSTVHIFIYKRTGRINIIKIIRARSVFLLIKKNSIVPIFKIKIPELNIT